jgi:hypothetical protein
MAKGVPAGVNRTSTAISRVVSFAVAVTVCAFSQVPGHHSCWRVTAELHTQVR